MMLGIAGLVATYIMLAVLLLSMNLYSKWPWPVKVLGIVITSAFYVVSYFSFPPLFGWPTDQALPAHFKLISSEVREPDKLSGEQGRVFLWLQELEDITSYIPPRAYELEYSKLLHTAVIGAQAKIDRGIAQLGEYEKDDTMQFSPDSKQIGKESLKIQFYDLPDPLIPDK